MIPMEKLGNTSLQIVLLVKMMLRREYDEFKAIITDKIVHLV